MDSPLNEGPTPCKAVVLIMNEGKMNDGHIEYGGMIRHSSVQTCPVGALGLYFFSRYHIEGVKFMNFNERSYW